MSNLKEILNELKWNKKFNLNNAEIWYLHRGAPNNTKIISGADIVNLEKSFMQTTTSMIPYHRILKITYKNDTIFKRRKK